MNQKRNLNIVLLGILLVTARAARAQSNLLCGVDRVQMSAQTEQSPQSAPLIAPLSAWTTGAKRLILIRVDFSDLPGAPFADNTGTNLVAALNSFYTEMSYAQTSFRLLGAGSALTATYRMPQPAAYYGTNNFYNQLRTHARNAATNAGYVLTSYNFDIICFGAVPGWAWSGLGLVGTNGAWLRNSFNTGLAAHELGHNFGLNHANFWDTGGQSVIGPGTSTEQGDTFDTMGFAFAASNHFNARYKAYLDWIPSNAVITATSNGTYRIYAHDATNATPARALIVPRAGGTNYWMEFRQKYTSNKWLMNGAGLRWGQAANQRTLLLDAIPGSVDGQNDSAVAMGRTFSDVLSGIHMTPIGKGGTTPESLDIVVNLGSFGGNRPPAVSLAATATNAAIGATLTFNATATDPDGDHLAYYWDFGDGNFGTNGPAASKSWNVAAEYVVRCLVSDMKGGLAAASQIVQIGSPATFRISGRVTVDGTPLVNARVYVSATRMAYTDSDGAYTIVGLGRNTNTVSASLYGYSFRPSGFTNPVVVGPNAANVSFLASNLFAIRFTSWLVTSQQVEFTLSGTPGYVYQVELSTNFNSWKSLTTLTNTTGRVSFRDSSATADKRRFYRCRMQ